MKKVEIPKAHDPAPWMPIRPRKPNVLRKRDGALFISSHPDNYDGGFADLLAGKGGADSPLWYFRGVRPVPKRKWYGKIKIGWEFTGEIWEPKDGREFEVIDVIA